MIPGRDSDPGRDEAFVLETDPQSNMFHPPLVLSCTGFD